MGLKADFQCFGSYEITKSGLDLGPWANPPPMFAPKTLTLIRCLINAQIMRIPEEMDLKFQGNTSSNDPIIPQKNDIL